MSELIVELYDPESGERGWLRYDTANLAEFGVWFQTNELESRVRTYLSNPQPFTILKERPKRRLDEMGVETVEMPPTTSASIFQMALSQMLGAINIGYVRPVTE